MQSKSCILRFTFVLSVVSCLSITSACRVAAQDNDRQFESLVAGLNDPSFRIRQDSFLKLCDSKLDIDDWLQKELMSGNKHREAVANWLKRLRQSGGSLPQRAQALRDFDAMMNNDDSVMDRYLSNRQIDELIELISIMPEQSRVQFFSGEDDRVSPLIERMWQMECEAYIPKILDLVLPNIARVSANRRWRDVGMPDSWRVDEPSDVPVVRLMNLERDGRIEEAIEFANRKDLSQWIELILIRNGRWDDWVKLDPTKSQIVGSENLPVQRAAILISLGRIDEAKAIYESIKKDPTATPRAKSQIALLVGEIEQFKSLLKEELAEQEFNERMFSFYVSTGDSQSALEAIGLSDPSMEKMTQWIKEAKRNVLLSEKGVEELARYGAFLHQLGYIEQSAAISQALIEHAKMKEPGEGPNAWAPLIEAWSNQHFRDQALKILTTLASQSSEKFDERKLRNQGQQRDAALGGIFGSLFPSFENSARDIYDSLYSQKIEKLRSQSTKKKPIEGSERNLLVRQAIEELDLIHTGRTPEGWIASEVLERIVNDVLSKPFSGRDSFIILELADLCDLLGETKMATELLRQNAITAAAKRKLSQYLAKQGDHENAAEQMLAAFRLSPLDLNIMTECCDALARVGRWDELQRVRRQSLSSLGFYSFSDRMITDIPIRGEIRLAMEQTWNQAASNIYYLSYPNRFLKLQYYDAAKKDLSKAAHTTDLARTELLFWVKTRWQNETTDVGIILYQMEQFFPPAILQAISKSDRTQATELLKLAHRYNPRQIDTAIDVIPIAESTFGTQCADEWFNIYYTPLKEHLEKFPNDSLIGNNTAWLAAKCNRELTAAQKYASNVVEHNPDPTYIDTLAEVEFRIGNIDRAIELAERCRDLDPRNKHHREQVQRFRNAKSTLKNK